jgi:hypothetical protein
VICLKLLSLHSPGWQRLGIFLFTTASRPTLGPTQPPTQWVPGVLSLWVRRVGREADHSSPSTAEVMNAWSYTSAPQYVFMAWCSVKNTGTSLPLPFAWSDWGKPHKINGKLPEIRIVQCFIDISCYSACLPACLPARPPARLPACPPARLPAGLPARPPACPPAHLPAFPPDSRLVGNKN